VITVVAFDIMDTLLRDPFREALRAATGLDLAELRQRRDPSLYPAFERGELTEAAYWAAHHDAGIAIDPEAFHRVRRAGLRWLPGMQALLAALQGRVRRVTASNYPIWIEELAVGPLAGHLDEVLASHHLGARKPDPAFFVRLLARLDVPATEVAFIDDRDENVAAAQAAGLAAHRFVDADGVHRWLSGLGVIPAPR
jgi:HAD superfamily hydrolase (TIGR01509 family)